MSWRAKPRSHSHVVALPVPQTPTSIHIEAAEAAQRAVQPLPRDRAHIDQPERKKAERPCKGSLSDENAVQRIGGSPPVARRGLCSGYAVCHFARLEASRVGRRAVAEQRLIQPSPAECQAVAHAFLRSSVTQTNDGPLRCQNPQRLRPKTTPYPARMSNPTY